MKKIIFMSTACAVLTACGGGGGSPGTTNNTSANTEIGPAVALSTSNYESAANEVLSSAASFRSNGTPAQNLLTGAQVTPMITPATLLQEKMPEVAKLLKKQAHLTGVQYTDSIPCDSGQMNVTVNDNNNNDELDAGDSAALNLVNCRYGLLGISGGMDFTVIRGSTYSDMTASDIEISAALREFKTEFDDFVAVGNGSFKMSISQTGSYSLPALSVSIVSPLMTTKLTQGGTTKVFQYKEYGVNITSDANTSTWSVNGNVSVPTLGANTATVNTTKRFSSPSNTTYATTGELLITVSNGGRMRVTATGTSKAKVELDLSSDGTYEEQKLIDWIDVL